MLPFRKKIGGNRTKTKKEIQRTKQRRKGKNDNEDEVGSVLPKLVVFDQHKSRCRSVGFGPHGKLD
jgi:hypothetical protein